MFLVFSNGRWQLAIAALASPFLARLFLFSQPVMRGLLILLLVQLGAYLILWWEVIPAPGVLYYTIAAAYGLCYFLPYVIDRLASGRMAGFSSTLVLPLSWYLVEVLIQRLTPYGSWSSAGYTQMGHGLLTPLAAWVGVSGVAFVTVWIASSASWLLMAKTRARHRLFVSALFAGSLVALVWLTKMPMTDETQSVRSLNVAGITPSDEGTQALAREVQAAMQSGNIDAAFLTRIDELSGKLNEELFVRSQDAARAGARLVVWSETAGHVLASREKQLLKRGQALAREHQVYLFLGLGVWHPGSQPPLENKVVAITSAGDVAWQYQKARPIVGSEAPFLPPGHNDIATLDTPYGRIGLVICHDLDFADFVAQAGRNDVNLMLAPSADWAVIADLHARMGVMRAVENGFWLLRPAYDGLSQVVSPKGKVVFSELDVDLDERVFHAEIPMLRSNTVYPHIRNYLPFSALALLGALLVLGGRGKRSHGPITPQS